MKKIALLLSVTMLMSSVDTGMLISVQDLTEVQEKSSTISENEEKVGAFFHMHDFIDSSPIPCYHFKNE